MNETAQQVLGEVLKCVMIGIICLVPLFLLSIFINFHSCLCPVDGTYCRVIPWEPSCCEIFAGCNGGFIFHPPLTPWYWCLTIPENTTIAHVKF